MNNTKFSEIYHIFLNSIQDYHIKNLFNEDIEIAEDLLETFLLLGLPNFYNCTKSLEYDLLLKEFKVELNLSEKTIISNFLMLSWLTFCINDITQMELNLNDSDFKHFSEERNLREKVAYSNNLREQINQSMVNYGLYNTNFSEWAVGNYGV